MEKRKVLIQVCGQPRILEPCLIWQKYFMDNFCRWASDRNFDVQVDWRYDLWENVGSSQENKQGTELPKANKQKITDLIHKHVPGQIKWYNYSLVDDIFDNLEYESEWDLKTTFHKYFSQTILRGEATRAIPLDTYDIAILCRTDHLFFTEHLNETPETPIKIYELLFSYLKRKEIFIGRKQNKLRTELKILSEYVEFRSWQGIGTGDQVFISTGNGLQCMYTDYRINIQEYVSELTNIGSHPDSIIDPHHIAIQLTHSNHMQHEWNNRSTDKHGLPHRYFPYVVAMPEDLNFHAILRPQHEHILSDGSIDIQKFKEVITGWKKSLK